MASLAVDPSNEISAGGRLTVQATGLTYSDMNSATDYYEIKIYVDSSLEYTSTIAYGDASFINTYTIPSSASRSVEVILHRWISGIGWFDSDSATVSIAASSHTVTMFVYIDGSYSGSFEDSVDDGGSFDIQNFVESSISSQRRLDYIIYNSQKYTSYFIIYNIYSDISLDIYLKKRPSSWSWTSTIASGYEIKISASEWNSFTSRINSFRTYVGASSYSFTTVSSGTDMTPTICNQARSAINDIANYQSSYSVPSALTAGNYYASFFNGLKNVLNAIQ